MKRQQDRESPPRSKRTRGRSPFNRRSYRDNNSPEFRDVRHSARDSRRAPMPNRRRSPVSPRYTPPPIDSGRSSRYYREQEDTYTTLVVYNFSSQVGRDDIEESLHYEFRKFGEVVVKVTRDATGERIAYATFRSPDDARDCKNAKGHLVMHDRRLAIDIAYDYEQSARSSPRDRSPLPREPAYSPVRRRSPVMGRQSPPRRRSPKRMSGRGRSPPRERVPLRDRTQHRDRFSPPSRMSYKDRRNSDDPSSEREPYSPRDSPRGQSPLRNRSISKERMRSRSETSRDRQRSQSSEHTPERKNVVEKQAQPAADAGVPSMPNMGMNMPGPGFPDSNFFPGAGFVDKHIPPEDDPSATRTLFVGNLEPDITSYDIRRKFEPFGQVDDIDVKRAARGVGSYCFIRFADLNEAYKAKITLNGKPVLKNVVRIGYGKLMLSSKIWVGGLGNWTTLADLEREFDRFGAIRRIEYRKGDSSASILYETVDAAQAACNHMRGFLMPNAETRLRMDFLDPEPGMPGYEGFLEFGRHDNSKGFDNSQNYGQSSNDRYTGNKYKNNARYRGRNVFVEDRKYDRRRGSRSRSPRDKRSRDYKRGSGQNSSTIKETAMTEMQFKRFHAKSCYSLHDLCQCFDPPCWQGGFVLKKVAFPVLFFLLDGDMGVFNTTTADPNSPTGRQTMFHVTQRLRLNEDKVKEVSHRMKYCEKKTCLIVAVPGVPENLNTSGTISGPMPTQHKPLRGLVKYFKEKEAAAIVSVPYLTLNSSKDKDAEKEKPKDKIVSGVLHCFPPGPFATEQLLKIGPSLQPQFFADDYMVVLLVKGSSSALL